jgi:NAD(P)-dependent dehydrogenase (short-subunit alcohol dehydrogenase family)
MDSPDVSSILLPGLQVHGVAVTGAASGIGRATAILAARSGASVVAGDINEAMLAEVEEYATTEGLAIRCVHLDLADPTSIADFIAVADEGSNLRGVVNAAGIAREERALDVSLATWNHYQMVLLTGPFLVAQGAARIMVARGTGGSIVNVSSAAATMGAANLTPYTAAKAGLIGMTKALAREWGQYGVRVNCISPGAVDTPLYRAQQTHRENIAQLPIPRIGTPDDLALAIGFFLADQSPWITGQNLNVNGGALMH